VPPKPAFDGICPEDVMKCVSGFLALVIMPVAIAVVNTGDRSTDPASLADQFVYWVEQKEYAKAKSLLDQGVEVNVENRYGMSALAWAAQNDDLDGIKLLISWGAKPKLEHQLLVCPRREFSEAMTLYLGELIDTCRCVQPAEVMCSGSEGQYERWCGARGPSGRGEVESGLYISGQADGCQYFYRIHAAKLYQHGRVLRKWERDRQSGMLMQVFGGQ